MPLFQVKCGECGRRVGLSKDAIPWKDYSKLVELAKAIGCSACQIKPNDPKFNPIVTVWDGASKREAKKEIKEYSGDVTIG